MIEINKMIEVNPFFIRIPVEIVLDHPLAEVPFYATEGASGFDLKACIDEPITLKKYTWQLISSGYRVSVPYGFEIQIRPRSGAIVTGKQIGRAHV